MTDDRWSLRGIPADLQKAAVEAARHEGRTVGRWLSDAIQAALAGPLPGREQHDGGATLEHLAKQLADINRRLTVVERRTDGGQMTDNEGEQGCATSPPQAASPPAADTDANPGVPAVSSDDTDLAMSVKSAREAQGLSQRALADKSGVPQSEICKLERGTWRATTRAAENIARVRAALGLEAHR